MCSLKINKANFGSLDHGFRYETILFLLIHSSSEQKIFKRINETKQQLQTKI